MSETTTATTTASTGSCCTPDGSCHSAGVTTVYQVSGMTCGHCVSTISRALGALPGVTDVEVDLTTGKVTVAAESEPDEKAVAAAIDDAGYELTGRA
ncbi:heavy-metal-associated domain-containing protein [Streptomyces sp. NPDC048172]|uniref:heavy-metal-associated domain-containing protein n=1 Tax=Streptomyces sp. NPDC048172 TaxID=3365505 RepID=UPI0037213080